MKAHSEESSNHSGEPTRAIRVVYSGRVQGVGFRHTAKSIADEIGIDGWVRNLHDGTVELVAGGSEARLSGFLQAIENRMAGRIFNQIREQTVLSSGHSGFEIRR
jgi:acylphosphatase